MNIKQHPKENSEELALVKVASWTWYRHGLGSEQSTVSEGDYTEDTQASTPYIYNPLFSTNATDSSLLDVYEIERISKDIDNYIECTCDKYYCRKSVDGVHGSGSRRIVALPEKDFSGTKAKRTNTQRKWFRQIYELCGANKGDVVENVGLATQRRRSS